MNLTIMPLSIKWTFLTGVLSFLSAWLLQAEEGADKSQFHLFNPTPDHLLRDLSTDRPDLTESPYTVDAGHFQIETDFVDVTFDRDQSGGSDVRSRSEAYGGVTDSAPDYNPFFGVTFRF